MALRSHESSTSLSSVDRFSDAMRVLSRRDAAARARARREAEDDPLSAQAWAANDADDAWDESWDEAWDDAVPAPSLAERLGGWRDALTGRLPVRDGAAGGAARRPSTPVVRRRRLLARPGLGDPERHLLGVVGPRARRRRCVSASRSCCSSCSCPARRCPAARAPDRGRCAARQPDRPPPAAHRPAAASRARGLGRWTPIDVPPTGRARRLGAGCLRSSCSTRPAFEAAPAVRHDEPVARRRARSGARRRGGCPRPAAALGEAVVARCRSRRRPTSRPPSPRPPRGGWST
jgi:hypothetical protein